MPRPSASLDGARRTRAGVRGLRRCIRAGVTGQRHDRPRAAARRAAAGLLRDRLPDSRQRLRSRGRGAGSAAAGASGARCRRADRVAARVRRHRDHPAGDQRAALRARPPRALRRRVAAGAYHHRRRDDPARHAETVDSLSLAMLVLLESLSPEQRDVMLLRDVFDYGYAEIAAIVGKSEDNVRQLATRARRHAKQRRPRFQTMGEQRDELARRFFAAAEQGNLAGLEVLLAHDVELAGDGGGKVPALARSLRGRNRVARALINWVRLAARVPGVSLRPVEVNGDPGALFLDAQQRLISVLALDVAGGQITNISSVVNPDKLTHLGPVADHKSLLRSV